MSVPAPPPTLIRWAGVALLSAGAADAAPRDCVSIREDAARLACFDREHGTPAVATRAPAPSPTQAAAPSASRSSSNGGLLTRAWALDTDSAGFQLYPYRSVYVLPLSITDNINRRPSSPAPGHDVGVDLPNRRGEVKYQFSAKTLAVRGLFGSGDLWVGYTQSSRWQLYQGDISRPFRETNYEPELLLNFGTDFEWFGWRGRILGASLNHQSNGRALPLSRSWNRVIGHVGFERGDWSIVLRPWLRIDEDGGKDDNPDIEDHIGRADLTVRHETGTGHLKSLRLRHSLRGGDRSRGSAELEWAFPLHGRLNGYVQYFGGYGESLIDYNIRQNRLGLGFSLAGWQ